VLGPFVGFRYSTDYGKSWHETSHTPAHPLFSERIILRAKSKWVLRMLSTLAVRCSIRRTARLISSRMARQIRTQPRNADLSWITGDEIYLARVKPSPHNIDTAAKYEFFAGYNRRGEAIWTHNFASIKPCLSGQSYGFCNHDL